MTVPLLMDTAFLIPTFFGAMLFGVAGCVLFPRTAKAAVPADIQIHEALLAFPAPVLAVFAPDWTIREANQLGKHQLGLLNPGTQVNILGEQSQQLHDHLQHILASIPPSSNTESHRISINDQGLRLLREHPVTGLPTPLTITVFAAVCSPKKVTTLYMLLDDTQIFSNPCLCRFYNSTATEVFFYRDVEGKFLFCNKAFEEATGLTLHDIFGKTTQDCPFPPDLAAAITQEDQTVRQSQAPYYSESHFHLPGIAQPNTFLTRIYPDLDRTNQIQGFFSFWRDITHGDFTDRLLKQQSALLQAAIDATTHLFSTDNDTSTSVRLALSRIVQATRADFADIWKNHPAADGALLCTQLFKWTEPNTPPNLAVYSPTLQYATDLPGWEALLAEGESINTVHLSPDCPTHRLSQAQGLGASLVVPIIYQKSLWGFIRLGVTAMERRWSMNENIALRAIGLFITTSMLQKETRQALQLSKERFKNVTDAAGEIIWELNADGYISYISERAFYLMGYRQEELLGKQFDSFAVDKDDLELTSRMFSLGVTQGSFRGLEHKIRTKSGEILWFSTSGSLMTGDSGIAGLRGTSMDVTQNKLDREHLNETMQALESANQHLEQAVKAAHELAANAKAANQAKTDFIANISHELRTPLNAIIGMSYLVENTELSQKQHDYVKKISTAGQALLRIVDDILDFSKIESGQVTLEHRPFTLEGLVENLAILYGPKADEKGLKLIFDVAPDLPNHQLGDEFRLHQILSNLISNSIKFTETGYVHLSFILKDLGENGQGTLRITVRDSGIGMSQEQVDHLFYAFSQADMSSTRRFGGTGLGLVLTKHLVSLASGNIDVFSSIGVGTAVSLTLPFTRDSIPTASAANELPNLLMSLPIMVVEEDSEYCAFVVDILRRFGAVVHGHNSIGQALAHLSIADNSGSPFKLVILSQKFCEEKDGIHLAHLHGGMQMHHPPHTIGLVSLSYSKPPTLQSEARATTLVYEPIISFALYKQLLEVVALTSMLPQVGVKQIHNPPYFPGARILLVDDNILSQQLTIELLREVGVSTYTANDGLEALRFLEGCEEVPCDLIFMDLQMPHMDGYTATQQIRNLPRYAYLPIIAMTAHASPEERQRCLDIGMSEHLTKPIDVTKLYETLKMWLPSVSNGQEAAAEPAQELLNPFTHGQLEDLRPQLSKLIAFLRDDDAEARVLFNSLKPLLLLFDANATHKTQNAMDLFDFSAALSYLEPLAHGLSAIAPSQISHEKE